MKNIILVLITLSVCSLGFSQQTLKIDAGHLVVNGSTSIVLKNMQWVNNGNFDAGTGTVHIFGDNASAQPDIGGSSITTFYNLKFLVAGNSSQLNQIIQVDNELQMTSGTLNLNNNDILLNGSIIGETTSSYIHGSTGGAIIKTVDLNTPSGENPGNIGVAITSSANLGTTTIYRGHVAEDVHGQQGIERYYDIIPANNAGLDATIQLYYFDHELNGNVESNLTPYRFNGTDWDDYPINASDATANWVVTENVDAFSKWTLAPDCILGPVISCPAAITTIATSEAGAIISFIDPVGTDNCSVTTSQTGGLASGSTFPLGTTINTFTATDAGGNSVSCSFNVTVTGVAPEIVCPMDITVSTETGLCSAVVDFAATDNVGIPASTITYSTVPGSIFSVGTTTVTATATNAVGTSSCTFVVEVLDESAPMPVCLNASYTFKGESSLVIEIEDIWDEANSTDNCGEVFYLEQSVFEVTCDQVGTEVPVTVTVEDTHGNTATCVATVTVDGLTCGWQIDPAGLGCNPGEGLFSDPNTFTLTSEGCYDLSYYRLMDQHGFIQQELCGDGEIIAQVTDVIGTGWAGISMRESNDPSARMLQLMSDGQSLSRRELRSDPNSPAFTHTYLNQGRNWLRLSRVGNQFTAYHSVDGVNWEVVLTTQTPMASCINVGLITMNGSSTGEVTGVFENVSISGTNTNAIIAAPTGGEVETSVESQLKPTLQIAPNPMSDHGMITISLPEAGNARISILDLQGRVVRQLHDGYLDAGDHQQQWDGADRSGSHLPAGMYLVQLRSGEAVVNKKVVLLKYD